jgi:hypothetical protein
MNPVWFVVDCSQLANVKHRTTSEGIEREKRCLPNYSLDHADAILFLLLIPVVFQFIDHIGHIFPTTWAVGISVKYRHYP